MKSIATCLVLYALLTTFRLLQLRADLQNQERITFEQCELLESLDRRLDVLEDAANLGIQIDEVQNGRLRRAIKNGGVL